METMPIFGSWAEVFDVAIQIITLTIVILAKSAFDKLRARLVSDRINPKLIRNIENALAGARQNFSASRILGQDTSRYFAQICQNLLDFNRHTRRSTFTRVAISFYKAKMKLSKQSRRPEAKVQKVWNEFDVYVEGWMARSKNDEAARKVRDRYAS
jgi:hypothetical protein